MGGSASSTGGDTSGGGNGAVGDAAGDSCNVIFTCIGQCADDSCANDCYAKGSSVGKQTIDALLSCLDTNSCTDAPCAKMYCQEQIDACVNDVSAPSDSGPPVTQGNIDPSLVGDWRASSTNYHFDAAGNYSMVGVLSTDGPCIAFDHITITNDGVAQTQGNVLTVTATTNKKETLDCSGYATITTEPGDTQQFTWSISGSILTLVSSAGAVEFQKQ